MATAEITTANPLGWLHTNIYAGGSLIATYENDGTGPHFRLTDWLGTMRAQTTYAGVLELTCQSLPFGETPTPCSRATEQFFTGKERDSETGNDYFGARYYNSNVARWLSPDWSAKEDPVPYAIMHNPQSLNLYTYLFNNPLGGVDADGHGGSCNDNPALCASIRDAVHDGGTIADGYQNFVTGQLKNFDAIVSKTVDDIVQSVGSGNAIVSSEVAKQVNIVAHPPGFFLGDQLASREAARGVLKDIVGKGLARDIHNEVSAILATSTTDQKLAFLGRMDGLDQSTKQSAAANSVDWAAGKIFNWAVNQVTEGASAVVDKISPYVQNPSNGKVAHDDTLKQIRASLNPQ